MKSPGRLNAGEAPAVPPTGRDALVRVHRPSHIQTSIPERGAPPARARRTNMSVSLIIDARHRLRWHQRLASDLSTAILWSGWLWLWVPVLRAYASLSLLGARVTPTLGKVAVLGADDTFGVPVAAILGASGTLFVWNRLPAARASAAPAPAPSLRDYAHHFELPEHELRTGREASVCVVHHDAHGRIVRLESRDPVAYAERLSA